MCCVTSFHLVSPLAAEQSTDEAEDISTEEGAEGEEPEVPPMLLTHGCYFSLLFVTCDNRYNLAAVVAAEVVTEEYEQAHFQQDQQPQVHLIAEINLRYTYTGGPAHPARGAL